MTRKDNTSDSSRARSHSRASLVPKLKQYRMIMITEKAVSRKHSV